MTPASDREQTNKQLMRELFDIFNSGDEAQIYRLINPSFVNHQQASGVQSLAIQGFREMVLNLRTTYPDLRVEIEDLIAEADKVVARVRWQGTDLGGFHGKPATGQVVSWTGIDIIRFSDGQAVEHWGISRLDKGSATSG